MLGLLSALATALTSLLALLLLLALTRQLWSFRWSLTRDPSCELPLPGGSMGWPLVGETFQWLFQVRAEELPRVSDNVVGYERSGERHGFLHTPTERDMCRLDASCAIQKFYLLLRLSTCKH